MSEYRAYYRKILLHMGVLKPSDEEIKEMQAEQQNQQPDPNAQYLAAAAAGEVAKAGKAQADAELAKARAEESRATTLKTLTEVGTEHLNQTLDAAQAMQQAMTENETGLPAATGAPPA
jgi:pantothenate kinase